MTKREIAVKKREAVHLFIVKGYPQKEIARTLGLSEKTISIWSKNNGWNDKLTKDINKQGGVSELMKRFFDYFYFDTLGFSISS